MRETIFHHKPTLIMNASLKKHLYDVSEKSILVTDSITMLIKENLTLPAVNFFQTDSGKDLLRRIQKKLLEKATGIDNRYTCFKLEFSTSEEVEGVMKYKDEIISLLKNEIGLKILYWDHLLVPAKNWIEIFMDCTE